MKQTGASLRGAARRWLKALYWKVSPLYRRLVTVEKQCEALSQRLEGIGRVESKLESVSRELERIHAVSSELREDGNGRRSIIQRTLESVGGVASKLNVMDQTVNMVSVKTSATARSGGGGGITVFFLVHNIEVWSSLHGVYRAMLKDGQFAVIVASCNRKYPAGTSYHDEEVVHEGLQKAGVHHIRFTSVDGWEELAILKRLRPDVIFRQSQWDNDIPSAFAVENLRFARLYFVPYTLMTLEDNSSKRFSTKFPYHLECAFALNEAVKQEYEMHWADGAGTVRVAATGHPRVDEILNAEPDWPLHTHNTFRALWSPHHSIFQGWLDFGAFLTTCEPMLALAADCADADFVLAPHPGLIGSLERLEADAPETYERARNFFAAWERLPNTGVLWHGGYMTAMKASDMLITDGVSLLSEFQFANKPLVFIEREGHAAFNGFGIKMSSGWNTVASDDMAALREMVLHFKAGGVDSHRDAQIENVAFLTQQRNAAENIVRIIKQDMGR